MTIMTLEKIHEDIIGLTERMNFLTEIVMEEREDSVLHKRLNDVQEEKVEGRSEAELDTYLKKRGVQVD